VDHEFSPSGGRARPCGPRLRDHLRSAGIAGTALAQAPGTGSITGKLTEKGGKEPSAPATVVVLGTKQGAQTGEDGSFNIRNVAPGTYQVRVLGIGLRPGDALGDGERRPGPRKSLSTSAAARKS
jgi:hypothetical protein